MSPRRVVHYSRRYSHVTLVSGYVFENLARFSANQSAHTIVAKNVVAKCRLFSQVKEKSFTNQLE